MIVPLPRFPSVPDMAERGFGHVLFMSSVAAFTGGMLGPHYAASKAGLHRLTYWLSSQYAARGVTVNAIAPPSSTAPTCCPSASIPLNQPTAADRGVRARAA